MAGSAWSILTAVVYGEDKQVLCEIKDKAFTLHHTVEAVGGGGVILKAEQAGNSE